MVGFGGQVERSLAELGRCGARAAPPRMVGRPLELGGHFGVGSFGCERPMTGTLLVVADKLRERGVEASPGLRVEIHVGSGCEQRMAEPDAVAFQLEHVCRERRVERFVTVARGGEERQGRVREGGRSAKRAARAGRKCVDPVMDELLKLVGNRQRLAQRRDSSGALERASQLEREERVASGHVVDPPQRRAGKAQLDPGSKETVHRAEAERADVEPTDPILDERSRDGLARPARGEHPDPFVPDPPPREGKDERRRGVEPLEIVNREDERALGRQETQGAEGRDRDGALVGRCSVGTLEEQRDPQGIGLRRGKLLEQFLEHGVEQIAEAREREPRFGLGRSCRQDAGSRACAPPRHPPARASSFRLPARRRARIRTDHPRGRRENRRARRAPANVQ